MKIYTCYHHAYAKAGRLIANTIVQLKGIRPSSPFKQLLMRIHLTAFIIGLAFLNVSAGVYAQRITLRAKDAPLETVFEQIKKQSGYFFWYEDRMLDNANKVTLNLKDADLKTALDACFRNQPLEYSIKEKMIVVKPRAKAQQKPVDNRSSQIEVSGKVIDENGEPLSGASVKIKGSALATTTDNEGKFRILNVSDNAVLIISYLGFEIKEVVAASNITVSLRRSTSNLEEVQIVNTGYQQLPKERATGSFVQIDNELLNRRVSTNVLDRLDGVTSGLIFNKSLSNNGSTPRNETIGISIRGRSTIDAKVSADPLIVIDNFPYEGDVANINPNDVESITVLKDAAAASIWGARSGNGVIVITTKKGKLNQPLKVSFNSNITVGQKPDLFYSKNYLTAPAYIEIETYLFNQGAYNTSLNNTTTYPLLSPIVEILAKKRAGTISATEADAQISELMNVDVRNQVAQYLIRNSVKQQYSLGFNGGSQNVTYNFNAGYDDNLNERFDGYRRLNLTAANTYRPFKNFELTTSLNFSQGNEIRGIYYTPNYPYLKIADDGGNPLTVPYGYRTPYLESMKNLGFLDWGYRPLEEKDLVDNTVKTSNTIFKSSLKYNFLKNFTASVQYQFENQQTEGRNYQSLETYDARSLINRYSQRNSSGTFTYPMPIGAILSTTDNVLQAHNLRTQVNYDHQFREKHTISALGGAEIREIAINGSSDISYGYNDEFGTSVTNLNYSSTFPANPSGLGSITLPTPNGNFTGTTNRFISYYINGAYSYDNRYTVSLSGRKDGANIFGAKTNDKMTPLWSAGMAWDISKEAFYNLQFLPYLKLRATYGYNGNVYNASAYLIATYRTNGINGNQIATITSAPNAELRWEKIRNTNIGLDFSSLGNRFSGTIEVYSKYATDLIEDAPLAPSSGFTTYKGNAASLRTKGMDVMLSSKNITGPIQWSTNLLFNIQRDEIVKFDPIYNALYLARFDQTVEPASNGVIPVVGNSLFGIYSFKSAGLDPANGDPLGYLNGSVSKDYTAILNNTKIEDLIYHGSSRPNIFGSLRNTFEYKGLSLSLNVSYKFDYYFRRKSINLNYTQLLSSAPHDDYYNRWQKPGDETNTNVPSLVYATNANRNNFYRSSDVLVEKGDHIRLQDISLAYSLPKGLWKNSPFSALQLYSYINNVGIIWRANKAGIDPDKNDLTIYSLPAARTIAFGIRGQLK